MKHWQKHRGMVADSVNGFDVIDCEVCGFKHIIPIPTSEELDEVYRHDYYAKEKPLYLEQAKEDLEWWNLAYSDRYSSFEELLSADQRRILDVGSGPGFFLLHGKNRGWQTLGVEPSMQAASYARSLGLEIIGDFLTPQVAQPLGCFDVVHMSEVLEHLPEPVGFLKLTFELLKPGGIICISVPNDYNPVQKALIQTCGFQPWWVAPPHHINYFNFDSLKRLLENNGFSVVKSEASFPIDLFLLMGDNYVGNDKLGRECHKKRQNLELNLGKAGLNDLKRELYRVFAEFGLGRQAIVYGKRS